MTLLATPYFTDGILTHITSSLTAVNIIIFVVTLATNVVALIIILESDIICNRVRTRFFKI